MKIDIKDIFNKVVSVVFVVILLAIILALFIGVGKLSVSIWQTFTTTGITGKYLNLITDILTLFVLVELSKSLVEYFNENRLRMIFIVDAGIVFLIREIMIMVFQHNADPSDIYAISALLLVLTILRIGSIMMFHHELRIVRSSEKLNH